ncbi:hypothetical protein AG1IA_02539 [Rhizoctonia solani AG-1 IA]|uniref:Uncharacterized protein n=1 Tax=Thanatephorus cucumeris (strain AG1-IA) TaxID=983506 RepID=L8X2V9_THACA|nr:hypothetical protein AG1IA_02539 [Rhizoctonia solani AG-1 IA]
MEPAHARLLHVRQFRRDTLDVANPERTPVLVLQVCMHAPRGRYRTYVRARDEF